MLGEYAVGQSVELTITVTDENDALTDATDVTCRIMHPDETTIDVYTLAAAQLTRVSLGTYTLTVVPSTSGKWKVKGESSNPNSASPDDFFLATPTVFP